MRPAPHSLFTLVAAATLVAAPACSTSDNNSGSAAQPEGSTTSTSESTSEGTATTSTGTDGSVSAGMTSTPTTTAPMITGTTGSTGTTSATSTTGTTTVEETTSTTAPPETTTGTSDTSDTSGTTEPVDETTGTTGPVCVPEAEVCNKLDDDCDGIVDNVDVGGDGICDCLSIALFGNEGWIPSAEFQAYLEAQGTQVDRIQLDNSPLTQELLEGYDIIILDWLIRAYSAEEAALVQSWVEAGGGLMSMTGHINDDEVVARANSLIGPMGLSYNTSQGYFDGPITDWLQPHPITKDITSVSFKGGLYVDMVDDGIGANTVVATLPPGPVGVAQVRSEGKVFAFGDEWIQFDSEWQQLPEIKQLWVNILGWLSPQSFCTVPQ